MTDVFLVAARHIVLLAVIHQRSKQTKISQPNGNPTVTTTYYAGAQEADINNGQATVKTYWPYGLGVEIDKPGAATSELNWSHHDRLGSIISISDSSGNLKEKLAYDSWGKRRTTDGSATPDNLDGQVDNKGYTGHEMLDQLDLVHMNGRIYDPLMARFLSADPLIQDPLHSQSYNRCTYVWNNTTNLTDPTGFVGADENASQQSSDPEKCDMSCRELRNMYNRCAAMVGNCTHNGPTGYENAGSNTRDNSGGKVVANAGKPDCVGNAVNCATTMTGGVGADGVQRFTVKPVMEKKESQEMGLGESLIPVLGSGKQAYRDFKDVRNVWGTVNTVLAISDVFLVKAAAIGSARGAWKLGSNSWSASRRWYGATRELPPNTQVHHWLIEQNSPLGKMVPNSIKNQPWNLNSLYATEQMTSQARHTAIHGQGQEAYNFLGQWWYGTPNWAKTLEVNAIGKTANGAGNND
ncbi:RHS repeat domain-containing protein [Undibacterium sp. WLX3042]|uniref:RHS repeat domain-containing protein n=1 Tax=Undibacterium sp. WLX3042 TaxID=3412686 RepID=UPI003C2C6F77